MCCGYRWRLVPAFLLAVVLCLAGQAGAQPPPGYTFMKYDEGIRLAGENRKKVFVYFGRYGCGFCDRTNKKSFSLEEVHQRYSEHYNLVYVDSEGGRRLTLPSGEQITEMQLGERMNTIGTPVFFFLETDGNEILKM